MWLDIELANNKAYTFLVIYRHQENNYQAFFETLDKRMFMLNKQKKKCLVLGDININLNPKNVLYNRPLLITYICSKGTLSFH